MIYRIAVLIPCYNEAATIGALVRDFRRYLAGAQIHVFDNNSTDGTVVAARYAGAEIHQIGLQGKGNVVRRMFADVEANIYVLVDGDGTYDASYASLLVETLVDGRLDMVVGTRVTEDARAYRFGHRLGNTVLTRTVATLFGSAVSDMLSGYRVFSRRYAKSFPAESSGFEIETELTVHALRMRLPVAEVPTPYTSRPEGSASKLNTYRDGFRILRTILWLYKNERPLRFFSLGFLGCMVTAMTLAWPLFATYFATGAVPRFPTAILCAALVLLGAILLACGIVLDTVSCGRNEAKRLAYLALPSLARVQSAATASRRDMGMPDAVGRVVENASSLRRR